MKYKINKYHTETAHKVKCQEPVSTLQEAKMASSKSRNSRLLGYTKVAVVGKGAFGTATLYNRDADRKDIVIKEVNIMEMPLNEKKSALNEVKVLSALRHPNIIKYFGSFESDGCLMIEMEYADGGTLSQFLDRKQQHRKRLIEMDVLHLFRQITSALSYMHKHNILHRDLKTANIFLTKYGGVKVGDFGISKMMSTLMQAQTVVGTPYYLSPEMCEGQEYDEKSDIWALGCVLYEMIELRKPFEATSLPALVKRITTCDFERISKQYSSKLQQLIDDILQKNTASRPSAHVIHDVIIPDLVQDILNRDSKRDICKSKRRILRERSVLYELKGFENTATLEPVQLPSVKLLDVSVGKDHCLALTEDSLVYSWGNNHRGQLGHGDDNTWRNYPICIDSLRGKNVLQVAAGDGFSIFLNNIGIIMTTGNGKSGCLGHGDWNSLTQPRILNRMISINVNRIGCGSEHAMCLTADGDLYAWGSGIHGRLGLGDEQNRPTLVKMPQDQKISKFFCGADASIVITAAGQLLACGNNVYNKLGLSSRFRRCDKSLVFAPVKGISRTIADICIGPSHTALITNSKTLITMGRNKEGQLGRGHLRETNCPREINYLSNRIIMTSCASTSTVIGTTDNTVYFWGTRYYSATKNQSPSSSSTNFNLKPLTQHLLNKDANVANVSFNSEVTRKLSELMRQPKSILGLYASPKHMAEGELVWLINLFTLDHTIFVWVNTTVPPPLSFEKHWHIEHMNDMNFGENV